jgi:hypothetical protein
MKTKKSSNKSSKKAVVKGRTVGESKFPASQQCEHKSAKHHTAVARA